MRRGLRRLLAGENSRFIALSHASLMLFAQQIIRTRRFSFGPFGFPLMPARHTPHYVQLCLTWNQQHFIEKWKAWQYSDGLVCWQLWEPLRWLTRGTYEKLDVGRLLRRKLQPWVSMVASFSAGGGPPHLKRSFRALCWQRRGAGLDEDPYTRCTDSCTTRALLHVFCWYDGERGSDAMAAFLHTVLPGLCDGGFSFAEEAFQHMTDCHECMPGWYCPHMLAALRLHDPIRSIDQFAAVTHEFSSSKCIALQNMCFRIIVGVSARVDLDFASRGFSQDALLDAPGSTRMRARRQGSAIDEDMRAVAVARGMRGMGTTADVARVCRSFSQSAALRWEVADLSAMNAATWHAFEHELVAWSACDTVTVGCPKENTSIYVLATEKKICVAPPMAAPWVENLFRPDLGESLSANFGRYPLSIVGVYLFDHCDPVMLVSWCFQRW